MCVPSVSGHISPDFIPAASAVVTSAKTDNTIIVNLRNMYFIDISFSYSGKIIE